MKDDEDEKLMGIIEDFWYTFCDRKNKDKILFLIFAFQTTFCLLNEEECYLILFQTILLTFFFWEYSSDYNSCVNIISTTVYIQSDCNYPAAGVSRYFSYPAA